MVIVSSGTPHAALYVPIVAVVPKREPRLNIEYSSSGIMILEPCEKPDGVRFQDPHESWVEEFNLEPGTFIACRDGVLYCRRREGRGHNYWIGTLELPQGEVKRPSRFERPWVV